MSNHIMTRGLSRTTSATVITQGYLQKSIVQVVVEQFNRVIKYGKSSAKKLVDETKQFVVEVSLLEVNGKELNTPLSSRMKIVFNSLRKIAVSIFESSARITKGRRKDIVITAMRVK